MSFTIMSTAAGPAFFKEVPEERYYEMLGAVPPAAMYGHGFLVGEAEDFGRCKVRHSPMPRYKAFMQLRDKFFEGTEPMTLFEFRSIGSTAS